LLKRIAAAKARLVKAREFREPRNAVEIKRDELPFASPTHWAWARLIDTSRPSYGFAFKSSQFNGDKRRMPLIRIRDISKAQQARACICGHLREHAMNKLSVDRTA
jgi:hypothetical protein